VSQTSSVTSDRRSDRDRSIDDDDSVLDLDDDPVGARAKPPAQPLGDH
jgi:hypothetical protein